MKAPFVGIMNKVNVIVKTVLPGSTGEALRLQPGDVITKLGGRDLASRADLDRALDAQLAGLEVTVEWTREGKPLQGAVVLKEAK